MSNELTDVRCPCGAEFQADSYDAGFIAGSGMCQNCDAAMPPKDIPAPVEQAGGDERVKCAVCVDSGKVYDISGEGPWKCYACTGSHEVVGYANGDELDNMLDDRTAVLSPVKTSFHTVPVYREARDALEQPSGEVVVTKNESGAIVSVTRQDKEGRVLSVIAESQPSPVPTEGFTHFPELLESVQQMDAMLKANSAQAEAERLEVVGVRYEDGTILSAEDCGTALEVCAKVQTPLMTVAQHERIVGELRAVIAQLRQHKNDYMDSGQETYRALQNEIREREAEIARLDGLVSGRTAERDAALAEVERIKTISDNYYVLCVERQQQLDAALAEVERLTRDRDDCLKARMHYATQLGEALARVSELEKQEPVALANRGLHAFWVKWTEAAAGLYGPGIKLYAAPVVQAQHSVPKEFIGRLSEFLAQRGATGKALLRELRALCAAAPGKEVGHE
ncbi:hypothetical protein P4209_18075 [Pseudomonas aeruginosa]|nr:hypothetical protein [Pseudomonas aeruginosa]MDF5857260.1 hypothetical protein [Pseudomonas aeruginosa]MDF5923113.1 hypothetical protein [Pseudomonas aeruginosa]HEK0816606.1 hypothetical protein [Pseudomonas aeruginosa]HEK3700725.1 hypothetical protein [Pseudomonas aeruginosa]